MHCRIITPHIIARIRTLGMFGGKAGPSARRVPLLGEARLSLINEGDVNNGSAATGRDANQHLQPTIEIGRTQEHCTQGMR